MPVLNGLPWVRDQLQALAEQSCEEPWELVVADNGSTDATLAVLASWSRGDPRVTVVDASAMTGAGAARNEGARRAKGDLLAFCDADDIVQPGWLAALVEGLEDADVVGGVSDYWSLNGVTPPPTSLPATPPALRQFEFLPAALSANLAVRRYPFEEIGGFDESLPTGEDTDLCWRLQLRGYRFRVAPDAVVARRDRSGFVEVFRRFLRYGRCGPILYQRYRDVGLRADLAGAIRAWLWLAVSVARLIRPDGRIHWAQIAGWRLGCLVESVHQRVLFL